MLCSPQLDFYPQAGIFGPVSVIGRRYTSHMRSSCREDIVQRFDALHDAAPTDAVRDPSARRAEHHRTADHMSTTVTVLAPFRV
jgi:hypothetical protein